MILKALETQIRSIPKKTTIIQKKDNISILIEIIIKTIIIEDKCKSNIIYYILYYIFKLFDLFKEMKKKVLKSLLVILEI